MSVRRSGMPGANVHYTDIQYAECLSMSCILYIQNTVMDFYVPKNTYRNIRNLKTLLIFLLQDCRCSSFKMDIAKSIPLSHINLNHYFTVSNIRPASAPFITRPTTRTTIHTDHAQHTIQIQSSLTCNDSVGTYLTNPAPNPIALSYSRRHEIKGQVQVSVLIAVQ